MQRQPADWAESNRRLQAALTRFPGDAQIWHLLGLGRANYDDFDAAVAAQRRAIALDPGYAEAHGSLAIALAYLGRFAEAQEAIDRCLTYGGQISPYATEKSARASSSRRSPGSLRAT